MKKTWSVLPVSLAAVSQLMFVGPLLVSFFLFKSSATAPMSLPEQLPFKDLGIWLPTFTLLAAFFQIRDKTIKSYFFAAIALGLNVFYIKTLAQLNIMPRTNQFYAHFYLLSALFVFYVFLLSALQSKLAKRSLFECWSIPVLISLILSAAFFG